MKRGGGRRFRRGALLVIGLAGLFILPGTAPADPRNAPASWQTKPSGDDMVAYYPAEALAEGRAGRAVILCRVLATGALEGCQVKEETPTHYWFGVAALGLSSRMEMNPRIVDGKPVESTVRVPVAFILSVAPPRQWRIVLPEEVEACAGIVLDSVRQGLPRNGDDADWYSLAVDRGLQRGQSAAEVLGHLQAMMDQARTTRAQLGRKGKLERCDETLASREPEAPPTLEPARPGRVGVKP